MKKIAFVTFFAVWHANTAIANTEFCWDPDGDGWGWDGWASCLVSDATVTDNPLSNGPDLPCIDTDGDGWGWTGWESCLVSDQSNADTAVHVEPVPSETPDVAAIDVAAVIETEVVENVGTTSRNATDAGGVYALSSTFGSEPTLDVVTGDIFAFWWDSRYDYLNRAENMLADAIDVADRLRGFGLQDPPNPSAGLYMNAYIHNAGDDLFPDNWKDTLAKDNTDMPYLVFREAAGRNLVNLNYYMAHAWREQASGTGYTDHEDSKWFEQAFVWWNVSRNVKSSASAFRYFDIPKHLPYASLWRNTDTNWMYEQHQRGIASFLYYLSEIGNVDPDLIAGGYKARTNLTPQEWMFNQIGGERMRSLFADWAAGNTAGMSYISEAATTRAHATTEPYPDLCHKWARVLHQGAASGVYQSRNAYLPESWSYNVVRIMNDHAGRYDITVDGDSLGTLGTDAQFEVRVVIDQTDIRTISMTDKTTATFSVDSTADTRTIDVIIAAVPERFTGSEHFPYSIEVRER